MLLKTYFITLDSHDKVCACVITIVIIDQCPVYEAISDYTAKTDDEVTYKKSEKVQVLQMRTDGWWKIRYTHCFYMPYITPVLIIFFVLRGVFLSYSIMIECEEFPKKKTNVRLGV